MAATEAPSRRRLLTIGTVCNRLQETQGRSVLDAVDVDSLTDILTGKAAPPA